jgi:hypothetical protein
MMDHTEVALEAMRLQTIARYWVDAVGGDNWHLARRAAWSEAEKAGLRFDAKQLNAALRRAWNRSQHTEPGPEPTPKEDRAYNQDQDQDQDEAQDEVGLARRKEGGDPPVPPPPAQRFSTRLEGAELYDLLERHRQGALIPEPVALGPMPPNATHSMRRVAADISLLIGLRLAVDEDRPLVYSTSFCAWRMGWATSTAAPDKPRASRVLRKLIESGVIECVGSMPRSDSRLFAAPSAGAPRRPGPEIPAVGVQPRVEPIGEVEQQSVVHEAEPVCGDDLGVVTSAHPAFAWHNGAESDSAWKVHRS